MKRVVLFISLLFLFSCAKKELISTSPQKVTSPPPKQEISPPEETITKFATPTTPQFSEEKLSKVEKEKVYGRSTPPLRAVFFDFDSYEIRDDMKPLLKKDAYYIISHPKIKIEIQGNCDERGSSEYNLALGEKRALVIKRYLINMGINPKRLRTVSFGEEKPLALGHNEEAWAINRRVDLVIIK